MTVAIEPAAIDATGDIPALQTLACESGIAIYDDYTIPPLTQTLEGLQAC